MLCEIYSPDDHPVFEVTLCKQIITFRFPIAGPFSFFKLIFLQNINLTFPPSNIHGFTDDLLTRSPKIGETRGPMVL